MLDTRRAAGIVTVIRDLGLLSETEAVGLSSALDPSFPFQTALSRAASIHVHVRVDDVSSLPHEALRAHGGLVENQREGYVKYAFAGGANVIFSAIDVAEDDRLPGPRKGRPHLDHLGIDLREESPDVRALFDEAPEKARALRFGHVAQGSPGKAVFCCHTSVAEKHWVYPASCAAFAWPIELAYGALQVHAAASGCDLRPMNPADPRAASVACCAPADAAPIVDLAARAKSSLRKQHGAASE